MVPQDPPQPPLSARWGVTVSPSGVPVTGAQKGVGPGKELERTPPPAQANFPPAPMLFAVEHARFCGWVVCRSVPGINTAIKARTKAQAQAQAQAQAHAQAHAQARTKAHRHTHRHTHRHRQRHGHRHMTASCRAKTASPPYATHPRKPPMPPPPPPHPPAQVTSDYYAGLARQLGHGYLPFCFEGDAPLPAIWERVLQAIALWRLPNHA